jgi:hypothetical protein
MGTGRAFVFYLLAAEAIDGDTLRVTVDQGMRNRWVGDMRINGVDAPELHSKDPHEVTAAQAARDFVSWWLKRPGDYFVRSLAMEHDKYGRLLGDVFFEAARSLSSDLRGIGCHPYDGGAKQPWTADELQAITLAAAAAMKAGT